jgi:hypothetical protein
LTAQFLPPFMLAALAPSLQVDGRWRQHEKEHSQCASIPQLTRWPLETSGASLVAGLQSGANSDIDHGATAKLQSGSCPSLLQHWAHLRGSPVFAADENACPMQTDFFRVPFSRRHSKDFSSAVCNRLIALRNNEDTIEHQSSNVVVMHVLGVRGFWIKRLGLYLSIASGSKLGFEGVLMH